MPLLRWVMNATAPHPLPPGLELARRIVIVVFLMICAAYLIGLGLLYRSRRALKPPNPALKGCQNCGRPVLRLHRWQGHDVGDCCYEPIYENFFGQRRG